MYAGVAYLALKGYRSFAPRVDDRAPAVTD